MVSENLPPTTHPAGLSADHIAEASYVDWAAILAGAVFALALSFLLIQFGASIGLSLTSPYGGEGVSARWLAIAAGIWFAWVMVTGFGAGGYVCGRMRRRAGDAKADEVEVRDGVHGLMVWATGALIGAILAAMGVSNLVSAGASAIGSASEAVGTATETAAEAFPSDYFANVLLRREANGSQSGAQTGQGGSPSGQGQDGMTIANIDPATQQQVASIIARSVVNGEIAERDRNYLAQVISANTGIDQEAASARIDEVTTEIANARDQAVAAIEQARVTGVVFGFIAAATLLVGAVAAFYAAAAGGRHRDEGLGFNVFTARR